MSNPTPPPKILNDSDDDDDDHSNDDSSQGMPKEEEGEEEETASPQRVLRGGMPSASLISARAPPPPSIMYTPGTSDRISTIETKLDFGWRNVLIDFIVRWLMSVKGMRVRMCNSIFFWELVKTMC
mmetsp:Transcript_47267/g.71508  ORF Transcript_47267/g.71508 Transcript_47267/m.71508 type:complete len:126 (-) Transcript_47267:364-741(-)